MLIDYRPMAPAGDGHSAAQWVDPDVRHAAELMRRVFEDQAAAQALGAKGAADIQRTHVAFERCVLRMVNLRGVELRRVQFIDCTLHDVDAYDLDAEDVGFAASDLERVNIDRWRTRRVDLRWTRQLGIEHVGALNGCLVTDDQLSALSYQLAFAAGLSIERATDPDTSQPHTRRRQ